MIRASSVVNCQWTPLAWLFRQTVHAATWRRTSSILPMRQHTQSYPASCDVPEPTRDASFQTEQQTSVILFGGTGRPITFIFIIDSLRVACMTIARKHCRDDRTRMLAEQLNRLLIHRNDRVFRGRRAMINFKHFLHAGHEFLTGKPNDIFFRVHDNSPVGWGKKRPNNIKFVTFLVNMYF